MYGVVGVGVFLVVCDVVFPGTRVRIGDESTSRLGTLPLQISK